MHSLSWAGTLENTYGIAVRNGMRERLYEHRTKCFRIQTHTDTHPIRCLLLGCDAATAYSRNKAPNNVILFGFVGCAAQRCEVSTRAHGAHRGSMERRHKNPTRTLHYTCKILYLPFPYEHTHARTHTPEPCCQANAGCHRRQTMEIVFVPGKTNVLRLWIFGKWQNLKHSRCVDNIICSSAFYRSADGGAPTSSQPSIRYNVRIFAKVL